MAVRKKRMEFREEDWITEVEAKCDDVSLSRWQRGLKRLPDGTKVTPGFVGVIRTLWFNRGLEPGTSARIRIAHPETDGEQFTVTFKKNSPHEPPGKTLHVKTKLEYNRPVGSFEEAQDTLIGGARSLGFIRPNRDLINSLTVTKHRTSMLVAIPDEEQFRADADRFLTFNPDPRRYEEERGFKRHHKLTEMERVDLATAIAKEAHFLSIAGRMKIPIDKDFAPLNTRSYLEGKDEM